MTNMAAFNAGQKEALAAAGFDTEEKIAAASDEDLDKVTGVGAATIKEFREGSPPVSREQFIQDQQRRADQEAASAKSDRKHDETVPGGRYMLDDGTTMVDANGVPYKEKAASEG